MDSPASPKPLSKEKKTRRRLRLSCVECTKRRQVCHLLPPPPPPSLRVPRSSSTKAVIFLQKCDRKYPCGSCTARNVTHLCRWESVPVARPAPQRPPHIFDLSTPPPSDAAENTIKELHQRIAALEKALMDKDAQRSPPPAHATPAPILQTPTHAHMESIPSSPQHNRQLVLPAEQLPSPQLSRRETPASISGSAGNTAEPPPLLFEFPYSPFSSPEPFLQQEDDADSPVMLSPLSQHIYQKAVTLAQISLAHHGEYVGRGSALDALYWVRISTI